MKRSIAIILSSALGLLTALPLAAEPALNTSNYFYLRTGAPQFHSSLFDNLWQLQNSRSINNLVLGTAVSGVIPSTSSSKASTADSIDLGFSWALDSGFTRGNVQLSALTGEAPESYLLTYSRLSTTVSTSTSITTTNAIDLFSSGDDNRYAFQYDQEIYPLADNSNKWLQGLGVRLGIGYSFEDLSTASIQLNSISVLSLPSGTTLSTSGFGGTTTYDAEQSIGTAILGVVYRAPVADGVEIDLSADYLEGVTGSGKYTLGGLAVFTFGSITIPSPKQGGKDFDIEYNGSRITTGLTYTVNDNFAIRASYMAQQGNAKLTNITPKQDSTALLGALSGSLSTVTTSLVLATLPDLGPAPGAREKIQNIGLEFQLRL